MIKNQDTAVIVPAYNEEPIIKKQLETVLKSFSIVICVNDGSKDKTLSEIKKTKAIALDHLVNIGQGGALETGIKYALRNPAIKYFITLDADGQHNLRDAKKMLNKLRSKSDQLDIIIGSRFIQNTSNIPLLKRLLLKSAIFFTNKTTGLKLTDTHNGLRVFNRKFAQKVNLDNFDMAHASEFLEIIKNSRFQYQELPVTINYTEYSKRKGQPILNAVNILFDIILK